MHKYWHKIPQQYSVKYLIHTNNTVLERLCAYEELYKIIRIG